MWIALPNAFLSIVSPKPVDFTRAKNDGAVPHDAMIHQYLVVRARKALHLGRTFPDFAKAILKWPARDYQFRVFVPREIVTRLVADQLADMKYTNFKDSVADAPLHDAYLGVWGTMNRYGNGGYDRRPGHQPRRPNGRKDRAARKADTTTEQALQRELAGDDNPGWEREAARSFQGRDTLDPFDGGADGDFFHGVDTLRAY